MAPSAYRGYRLERLAYGCGATRSASEECQRSASEESILEHARIVYLIHKGQGRDVTETGVSPLQAAGVATRAVRRVVRRVVAFAMLPFFLSVFSSLW
jgi:hypothetical protein